MLVLEPADLEDRNDVGVVEPGDCLGLVLEPADPVSGGEISGDLIIFNATGRLRLSWRAL